MTLGPDEPPEAKSVTRLLNSCRDDPAAWGRLWGRLRHEIARVYARALGRRVQGDPMDDPKVADSISRIFLEPRVWPSREAFFGFLFKVLQNLTRDEHRRATSQKRGGGQVSHEAFPEEVVDRASPGSEQIELIESIQTLMSKLREDHPVAHRVLELKMDGATWKEVKEQTGLPYPRAKLQWELARAWLRSEFGHLEA